MTDRKPAGMPFETWIDRQIREASERGEFDDLPGAGKPLPDTGQVYDENWWLKNALRREGLSAVAALPTPLRLRKEAELLPEALRELRSERAVREAVRELNERIAAWLRAPSGPHIPVHLVDVEAAVADWRARRASASPTRATGGDGQAATANQAPDVRSTGPRVSWWRRLLSRRPGTGIEGR